MTDRLPSTWTPPADRWLWIVPNVLSGLRLGLAIAFPLVSPDWRPALVVLAGGSDLVDGYLARRLRVTTWSGGLLDAGADKAFTGSVLFTLVYEATLAPWKLVALLARDLVIVGIAGYAATTGRRAAVKEMSSRLPGKVTTATLFVLFLLLLFPTPMLLREAVFWVAVGASGTAAVDYLVGFVRKL